MNQLKVHKQHSIRVLHEQGLSMREIARKLEIDRGTVSRYLASPPPNAAIPPIGSSGDPDSNTAISPIGSGDQEPVSNAAISPHGSTGRRSECDPFGEQILQWLKQGLTAQRIYQDLVSEHAFQGSYDSKIFTCFGVTSRHSTNLCETDILLIHFWKWICSEYLESRKQKIKNSIASPM